jgi:hypothetical protein
MSTKHEAMMVVIGKSKYSEEKHSLTHTESKTNKRNETKRNETGP